MSDHQKRELEPPPISQEEASREILRIWGGPDLPQQVSLNTTWEDPGAWGILLVDLARHVAKAYTGGSHISEAEALKRIKQLLDAEWDSSTDEPKRIQ